MKPDRDIPSLRAFEAASRFRVAVSRDAIPSPGRRSWSWRALVSGVAVTVLLVAATIPAVQWFSARNSMDPHSTAYSANRGERKTIELPDGSRVVLAPDTKVEYAHAGRERTVTLHGQAYFTVAHHAAHPFVVHSSGIATRVLGTSFVIRAYESDVVPHVAVTEGKVEVSTRNAKQTLLPGDIAHMTRQGGISVASNASMTDVVGWMRGQLVFDGVALSDVVTEIERVYAITITIPDASLAAQRVTMSLSGDSQQDMLESLAFIANAKITEERPGVIRLIPNS